MPRCLAPCISGKKMGRRTYYRRNKGIRWDLVLFGLGAVLLIVYGCLQYKTIKDQEAYKKTIVRFEALKEYSVEQEQTEEIEGTWAKEAEQTDSVAVSYKRLFEVNEDMIGWLKIPGTEIDYPVMQTMEDEEYYLYRNFFKEKDNNGTLILDTDSDITKTSNNLIIHGHNMKSGAMFGGLLDFEKEEYTKEHNRIEFYTRDEERKYEIIAVFRSKVYTVEDKVFKYYQFFEADNQDEFDDFYNNIKKMSLYDTGVTAQYGDEFITLSTCVYHTTNGRLVVVGKRIVNSND